MPRKSNQTEYDDKMSVFKQNPSRGESHRRSSRAHRGAANPHPTTSTHPTASSNTPVTPYVEFPAPSGASSGYAPSGRATPFPWLGSAVPQPSSLPSTENTINSPYYTDLDYTQSPSYNAQFPINGPLSDASSSLTYSGTSYHNSSMLPSTSSANVAPRPAVRLTKGNRIWTYSLTNNGYGLPTFFCLCQAEVRVLVPQTYAIPDLGVLWNFRLGGRSTWSESSVSGGNTEPSIMCPYCGAVVQLST